MPLPSISNPAKLTDRGRGLFVLLPVLNEIANIGPLLDKIDLALAGMDYTIGILDDGSRYGTVEFLGDRMRRPGHRLHLICRQKSRRASQRGSALRLLMLWVWRKHIMIFSLKWMGILHRPEELPDGIRLVASGQCDVAIASKYVEGSEVVNRPWGRRMVSKVCSSAVRLLISPSIRDYSNGYASTRDKLR